MPVHLVFHRFLLFPTALLSLELSPYFPSAYPAVSLWFRPVRARPLENVLLGIVDLIVCEWVC